MRIRFSFLLTVVLSLNTAVADEATDEDEVWKLEESYWQYAKTNDIESYKALWDKNFVGWLIFSKTPLGKENIADWIGPLHTDPTLSYGYELKKEAVRAFGDIVVAHYLVRDYLQSSETGHESNVDINRITHTWKRRGDSWQIITGMPASWIGEWTDE